MSKIKQLLELLAEKPTHQFPPLILVDYLEWLPQLPNKSTLTITKQRTPSDSNTILLKLDNKTLPNEE